MFRKNLFEPLNRMQIKPIKWISHDKLSSDEYMVMCRIFHERATTGLQVYTALQKEANRLALHGSIENCVTQAERINSNLQRLPEILQELHRAGAIGISYNIESAASYF